MERNGREHKSSGGKCVGYDQCDDCNPGYYSTGPNCAGNNYTKSICYKHSKKQKQLKDIIFITFLTFQKQSLRHDLSPSIKAEETTFIPT